MQPARDSRPSHTHLGAGERTRLRIAGVDHAIAATVARRRDDALVVVQELPFLAVGTEVCDEDGRPARIVRVAMDVSRERVPRLVLELAYDDDDQREGGSGVVAIDPALEREERRRRDATVGYDERPAGRDSSVRRVAPRARVEQDTLLFATHVHAGRDERPSMPAHLARGGSELELTLRAFFARFLAAMTAFSRGVDQAIGALRTDP